jgi:hypothetical protein
VGDQIEEQAGLDKAVIEQNFSDLRIIAKGSVWGSERWLKVQGHRVGDTWFVTAAQFKKEGEDLVLALEEVVFVGGLDFGNPFPDTTRCEDFTDPVSKHISIDHISFDFQYCQLIGTSGTTNYKIIEIKVADSHPSLVGEERNRTFDTEEEINAVADIRVAHHNEGDRFVLTLEKVK